MQITNENKKVAKQHNTEGSKGMGKYVKKKKKPQEKKGSSVKGNFSVPLPCKTKLRFPSLELLKLFMVTKREEVGVGWGGGWVGGGQGMLDYVTIVSTVCLKSMLVWFLS